MCERKGSADRSDRGTANGLIERHERQEATGGEGHGGWPGTLEFELLRKVRDGGTGTYPGYLASNLS